MSGEAWIPDDRGGEVVAIWLKRMKRGPMDPVASAELIAGQGLRGNANRGGRRQVTIIEEEVWAEVQAQLSPTIPPTARRANLMLRGIRLEKTRGKILAIGSTKIRVYGETRPCEQMDAAYQGLRKFLDPHWRGGVCGEVLEGGEIHVGDAVAWTAEQKRLWWL
ncbi:MAG TPA: MOSC domain-containing protein [Thermoanaerobaculia bacterium]